MALLPKASIFVLVFGMLFAVSSMLFKPSAAISPWDDYWHHAATIRALLADPIHPANPFVASSEPTRTFTPQYVALAMAARYVGCEDPEKVLSAAALLSMALLVIGIRLFSAAYLGSRSAWLILLFAILAFWGPPFHYAGFENFRSIVLAGSYPAAFAFALGFYLISSIATGTRTNRWYWFIPTAALTWIIILTHQLSFGFWMGFVAVWMVLSIRKTIGWIYQVIALSSGVALAGFWPHFDVFSIFETVNDKTWASGLGLDRPAFILYLLGPSLIGLVLAIHPKVRKKHPDLPVSIGGLALALVIGLSVENPVIHRFISFLAFTLQLATVAFIVQLKTKPATRWIIGSGITFLLIWQIAGAAFDVFRPEIYRFARSVNVSMSDPPIDASLTDTMAELKKHVSTATVTMAAPDVVYLVAASGIHVVSIPRAEPYIADLHERQEATRQFFLPSTDCATRLKILRRYNATLIAYQIMKLEKEKAVDEDLVKMGDPFTISEFRFVKISSQNCIG